MRLEQYRTLWGNLDLSDGPLAEAPYHDLEELVPKLAELGYDGIEVPFKMALHIGAEKVRALLNKHSMKMNCMVFTDNVVVPGSGILWGGPYPGFTAPTSGEAMAAALQERHDKLAAAGCDYEAGTAALTPLQLQVVDNHLKVFQEQVEQAYKLFGDRDRDATGVLNLVVSHSLKDNFPEAMAAKFFRAALDWEQAGGYTVCHETHRKRFLYSPWVTRDFFLKYPDIMSRIKLTADLSHWVNVAETDCSDPVLNQAIAFIVPKVYHTHCRVGYDHGPQVSDPRAPEWIGYMEGHERWWDWIWRSQLARGFKRSSMIAEHGPPNYQHTEPRTKKPLALIWDVNHWIHLRRQKRFAELFGEAEASRLRPSETQGFEPETAVLEQPPNIKADFAVPDAKRQRTS